jgi:hypothetical protein
MDALYLHEVIDIVGEQAVPYMEHSVLSFQEGTADRGLALWGTWYVVGGTGRWPQVVNLWEMADGWEGWERLCRATNLRRQANDALTDWWREAYQRRSGGFDRLLRPVEGTRTLADLASRPVRGTLFVHELTEVRPGAGGDYLAALAETWAPVAAEHGHTLVGAWEAVMNDTEVCTVWATTLEDHVALGRAATGAGAPIDERVGAWRAQARTWTARWREELMVPCPGTPMGPDAWEGTDG